MSAAVLPGAGSGTLPSAGRSLLRLGPLVLPVRRRTLWVTSGLIIGVLIFGAWALTLGDYPIPLADVWAALTGTAPDGVRRIVVEWRLPRIVLAVIAGASLGLSGAIFQSLTRNPLGSPDIIGFNAGAYTGALVVLLVLGGNYVATALGALAGGLVTALIVYLLAYRSGVQGFRLIVVGLAVSAMATALNTYLKLRASLEEAIAAASWGIGSLSTTGWADVVPVAIAVIGLTPLLALLAPRLRMLELGDDAARALGVPIERSRLLLLVVGVAFTAAVTAVAGPIAFVALAAPQLARGLTRSPGMALTPAASLGAALLLVSDVISQRALALYQLPVGAVTVTIGGAYLIGLLIRQARRK